MMIARRTNRRSAASVQLIAIVLFVAMQARIAISECDHFSFAYSVLTCFSRGMLGSASFQRVRKYS
jgi:hypothetical protein